MALQVKVNTVERAGRHLISKAQLRCCYLEGRDGIAGRSKRWVMRGSWRKQGNLWILKHLKEIAHTREEYCHDLAEEYKPQFQSFGEG